MCKRLFGRVSTLFFFLVFFPSASSVSAAQILRASHGNWAWELAGEGTVRRLVFFGAGGVPRDTIPFFTEAARGTPGPVFYMKEKGVYDPMADTVAAWSGVPGKPGLFRADLAGVECRIEYPTAAVENPTIRVTLHNRGHVPVQPGKMGLKLGLDTYMDRYPDWFGKYFPTLMRNEQTHFWGYFQSPAGKVLGIASAQPVASWSTDFSLGYRDGKGGHWFWGHRIESVNLDLINALPLPERHPQDLWQLLPGEERSWDIQLLNIDDLGDVEHGIAGAIATPMLLMDRTVWRPREAIALRALVPAGLADAILLDEQGREIRFASVERSSPRVYYDFEIGEGLTEGRYTVRLTDIEGKTTEGILFVRYPWGDYLKGARRAAERYHQKASSHIESWMGFYSAFIAARDFPEAALDERLEQRFELLFDLLHDTVEMQPRYFASRIQNTAGTIGMLVDKYKAYGDIRDLERAARLADWMIASSQREDGAYYNHGVIYTSVIYVAKSILELAEVERAQGHADPLWRERFERHYRSAKRAVDQLVASRGDFQTEGEHTFEDGMISCSALQIGLMGLWQEDPQARKHYTDAMLEILESHACLTQLRVPDARRRGGTMRYWEAQYDVMMLPDMFNSPHGWSAWRGYATYYAYLLTGDERWLQETFNAMGACAQLLDIPADRLYWAFVLDPYLEVIQTSAPDTAVTFDTPTFGNPHPLDYPHRQFVIGEQYVDMVSDWQTVNTQDNDVHEVFKLIGEVALRNAFVVQRADGEWTGYNCRVETRGKRLVVIPDEEQITRIHFNVSGPVRVCIRFADKEQNATARPMEWIERK